MKLLKILALSTLSISASNYASHAAADGLSKGCEGRDSVALVPSPTSENVLDFAFKERVPVEGGDLGLRETGFNLINARISLSFPGEPVNGGAWVLLNIENDDHGFDCYLIHRGSGSEETGFNYAYISKSVVRQNDTTKNLEVFIPVSEYPFALEENYKARMIEVNIPVNGQPVLIAD